MSLAAACAAALLVMLASPGLGAEKSRLIRNLEARKPQVVVAYGTSLTADGAWVQQLADLLRNRYGNLATVINAGQGSTLSKWGVENLNERVIQKKPDTVFLEFAGDDANLTQNVSLQESRSNLEAMVSRILQARPECEIILMTMNPVGDDTHPRLKDYYQFYRDVAKEHHLLLIDHYPAWEAIRASSPATFKEYVPDGAHPTAVACQKVVTPAIVKALGPAAADWKFTSGTYRLWLPEGNPAKGIFLLNSYGCWGKFSESAAIRELAAELGCAVVASSGSNYDGALEALADLARQSGRPELAFAPLFVFSHSNSTPAMAAFAAGVPDRIIAWCAFKSAFGAQFSSPKIYRIPGQVISGEKDDSYFQDQLATVKKIRQESGGLVHMIVEPNGPHMPAGEESFKITGESSSFTIVLAFMKDTFLLRVPAHADPRKGKVKLVELAEKDGWLGRNLEGVRLNAHSGAPWHWDREVDVRQKLEIAPYDKFTGDPKQASWLPSEDYAYKWQEFCQTGNVKDWGKLRAILRPLTEAHGKDAVEAPGQTPSSP